MKSVLLDAGPWLALFHGADRQHARMVEWLRREGYAIHLVSTWPVLTEATHLLTRWIGTDAAQALLREVADGAIAVWSWPLAHTERMVQLMARYASLPMDLADASLVLLAEELGHGRILTTDARDFCAYRFKSQQPFQNLLLESAHG